MATYVGFDASTQSLTATIIEVDEGRREIVFDRTINFDETFPEFHTSHGVIRAEDGVILRGDNLERMLR